MTALFTSGPRGPLASGAQIKQQLDGEADARLLTDAEFSALSQRTITSLVARASGQDGAGRWVSTDGYPVTTTTIADAGAVLKEALQVTVPSADETGRTELHEGLQFGSDVAGRDVRISFYGRASQEVPAQVLLRVTDAQNTVQTIAEYWGPATGFLAGAHVTFRSTIPRDAVSVVLELRLFGSGAANVTWVVTDIKADLEVLAPPQIAPATPGDINLARHGKLGVSADRDTAAWKSAWEEIEAVGGGCLIVPPVQLEIGETAELTADFGQGAETGIALRGAGKGVSTLFSTTDQTLLRWHQAAARDLNITLEGFNVILAAGGNNGSLFDFMSVPGGDHHFRDFVARDIDIVPLTNSTVDYLTRAFWLRGVHRPLFQAVSAGNGYGPGVSTATQQQGHAVFDAIDCYHPIWWQCYAWGCQVGYSQTATEDPGAEAGAWIGCVGDSRTAYLIDTPGSEAGGYMTDCHANYSHRGLVMRRRRNFDVTNFYVHHEEDGQGYDIELEDCLNVDITGLNSWFDDADDNRTSVFIHGDCSRIALHHPKFEGGGTAIQIEAGADQIEVHQPRYIGDITARLVDNGATNLVVHHREELNLLAHLAAAQSVADNTVTTVKHDTELRDVGQWGNPGAGTWTVPANRGVRKVRLTAQIVFAASSSGERRAFFTVNNAKLVGGPDVTVQGDYGHINLSSGILYVSDGDVIRLQVQQTSGAPLNLIAGNDNWLQIEVLNG